MSHELEYKAEQTMTTLDKNLGVDVSKRQLDYSLGKGNEEGREANPNQSANMAKPAGNERGWTLSEKYHFMSKNGNLRWIFRNDMNENSISC
ncbi:hypothetical protein [Geminisphaera colitermitum]|uniref:hypothetical protein n=1 Tax=Geminisphaera colitermitum TaxID=1148786 RepID=UPI0001964F10|nr:hypothetical protein [Geminisphaera colitermitum]